MKHIREHISERTFVQHKNLMNMSTVYNIAQHSLRQWNDSIRMHEFII